MNEDRDAPPKVGQQGGSTATSTWSSLRSGGRLASSAGVALLYIVLTGRLANWSEQDLDMTAARTGAMLILVGSICVIAPNFFPWCVKFKGRSSLELRAQIASITAFVLACALVFLLAPAIPGVDATGELTGTVSSNPQPWNEYSFSDGRFSVETPESWQSVVDSTVWGELYLADRVRDLHVVATAIRKSDVDASSTAEVVQLAVASIEEQVDSLETEQPKATELNGVPIVDVRGTATMQGTRVVVLLRYLDYGDTWVEMNAWATPSKVSDHRETFARIFDSIEIHR